ncbi:DNA repair protein RecN [Azonexus sp.]|uniref:DNA repair protein RecN n=1 Tax=Azonexus sp. TaxID=1872668 RepID=UPI0039E5999C
MLRQLSLRDFVIVDRLELEFAAGFSVLTGETGAGKSILIDALALALGERGDAGVVRAGCDKAEIVALFDVAEMPSVAAWLQENDLAADADLMLRRVVDANGRSRAWINGTPATVQQLREVGEYLVDIHGQHAHQSLLRSDAQRQLLDSHAGLNAQVKAVGEAWRVWRAAESAWRDASSSAENLLREREELSWQVDELEQLVLGDEEWSALDAEHRRLAHAASLIEGAQFALAALAEGEGACQGTVDQVAARLAELSSYDPALAAVAEVLASIQAELSDAVSSLRRYADRADLDPARLSAVEQRMEAVLAQARRFRTTPESLPELLRTTRARLEALSAASDLAALEARLSAAENEFRVLASALSAARQDAAQAMAQAVSTSMAQLALGSGRFEVALLPQSAGAIYGLEQVEFRIGGLSGQEARPLAKVASGGELSRISLAIQVLTSRSAAVPTLIFDEVDVGIGGGVAEIVGRLLHELGRERQVLCVTHLAQVAARADAQWRVAKNTQAGQVLSSIQALDFAERVQEVARMLGGVELTEITLQHAREMLQS